MLKVLTIILFAIFGGPAFSQNANVTSGTPLLMQLVQINAERSGINYQAQLHARDTRIAQQAEEIATLKREKEGLSVLVNLAIEQLDLSEEMGSRTEAMIESHCTRNASPFQICKEYNKFLLEYPRVYATWITSSEE